ncbi:phage/plasmid replication protein [Pseudomonas abietaniphila]|uniref:phage/plasmid replication domain-containing protein n=1 Tax=Pseudomonas abietaniphila TaxID=89065 RepID=UPI00321694F4
MFFDWIKGYQDFDHDLPVIGDVITRRFDADTDELLSSSVPAFFAEGSYSTTFRIHVSGRRITVDGNASRLNRLDNVVGIASLEDSMRVINALLAEYGLPPLNKCKTIQRLQDGSAVADGFVFQRLDLTSNFYVGKGNERAYLRGISSQRYRNSIAYLYPDGNTCVWTPKGGEKAGRLVYPGNYAKAAELEAHLLPRVKRTFGEESEEFKYVSNLRDWCREVGMVRSEIKCRSEFLKREGLQFWGLFDESKLVEIQRGFLMIGEKCEINNFDVLTVKDELLAKNIVSSTKAAMTTAGYVALWQCGQTFDFEKSAVKKHRALLRQLDIDIKIPFDATRHGVVFIRNVREVERRFESPVPSFYRPAVIPRHLHLVAA